MVLLSWKPATGQTNACPWRHPYWVYTRAYKDSVCVHKLYMHTHIYSSLADVNPEQLERRGTIRPSMLPMLGRVSVGAVPCLPSPGRAAMHLHKGTCTQPRCKTRGPKHTKSSLMRALLQMGDKSSLLASARCDILPGAVPALSHSSIPKFSLAALSQPLLRGTEYFCPSCSSGIFHY